MPFDKSKFKEAFKEETRDHLRNLSDGLASIAAGTADTELLKALTREAHTIRGSATMMGFEKVSRIGEQMEDHLDGAMDGNTELLSEHINMIRKGLEEIETLLGKG